MINFLRNKLFIATSGLVLIGGGIFGANLAYAQTAGGQTLVQRIAQRFNLNQTDVQSVFDQNKQEHLLLRGQNIEQKLTKLVSQGKLTEAQKQLVITKRKELETNLKSEQDRWKNLTPAERKAKRDQVKLDLENWAKQNGIDIKYLMTGVGRGLHMGMMK